jgi:hypothetical protein
VLTAVWASCTVRDAGASTGPTARHQKPEPEKEHEKDDAVDGARAKRSRRQQRNVEKARRVGLLATAVAGLLALSACQVVLTPDGQEYTTTFSAGTLTFTNTSSGPNERDVAWNNAQSNEAASTACATWASGTSPAQDGIIFRARIDANGGDGVELERSFYGATDPDGYFGVVAFYQGTFVAPLPDAVVNLSAYTQGTVYPLRVCASINANDVLSFAVAKGSDPMPALGTAGQGATFDLSADAADFPATGATGFYAAHVPFGTSLVFTNMIVDGVPASDPTS